MIPRLRLPKTPFGLVVGRSDGRTIAIDVSVFVVLGLFGAGLAVAEIPAASIALLLTAVVASLILHETASVAVLHLLRRPAHSVTLHCFGGVSQARSTTASVEALVAASSLILSAAVGIITFAAVVSATPSVWLEAFLLAPIAAITVLSPGHVFLIALATSSAGLTAINFIPATPLKAGRLVAAVRWGLSGDPLAAVRRTASAGIGFGLAFVFVGATVFATTELFIAGVILMTFGAFLALSASDAHGRASRRNTLDETSVLEVLEHDIPRAAPDTPVESIEKAKTCVSVEADGTFVGCVMRDAIEQIPPVERMSVRASQIMKPKAEVATLAVHELASDAIRLMNQSSVDAVPVVEHGVCLGIVRRAKLLAREAA